MKLVDAWIWAENIRILSERKDDKIRKELGVFPDIADATIYVSKGVIRKLKFKHHIYNGVEFVTKLLKNFDFAAYYEEEEGIINFYKKWTTQGGKTYIYLAGLAIKDNTITTCFPISQTSYDTAKKNQIELK